MLVNPRQYFLGAISDEFAVPAFTASTIEVASAVMLAAEEAASPAVIEIDEDTATFYGLKPLAEMLTILAEEVECPVALHLSYARHLPFVQACVEAGFTSVAVDSRGQAREIVQYAKDRDVWVEGLVSQWEDVTELVEKVGVDTLSVAVHVTPGAFTGREYLQFGALTEIERQFPKLPLAVRGVAGLARAHVNQLLESHVSKIVVRSEIAEACRQIHGASLEETRNTVRERVKALAAEKIQLFGSAGHGTL